MENNEISAEINRNFHLFWDNFPFPVMLIRKNRTIVALNKAGEAMGCSTGTRCVDLGKKEDHKGCLANKALQDQSAQRIVAYQDAYKMVLDSYWIPLAGEEDLYLHFSADITGYASHELFPKKGCGEGHTSCACSAE
jgi:hypothetical protein